MSDTHFTNHVSRLGLPAFALATLLWISAPLAVNVTLGQDGLSLRVQPPAAGSAPVPNPPAASAAADAAPEKTTPSVADGPEQPDSDSDASDSSTPAVASAATSNTTSEVASESDFAADLGADSSDTETESVRTLSVEPGSQPLLPKDRPAWVGAEADYTDDTHRLFVGSIPVADQDRADRALDEPLLAALGTYVSDQVLQDPTITDVVRKLQLPNSYIRKNLINDPEGYMLEITTSNGPMYQKWVALEITPPQRRQLEAWYREAEQRDRIFPLGAGLAAVVGLVGLSHLVLRRKSGISSTRPLAKEALAQTVSPPPAKKSVGLLFMLVMAVLLVIPGLLLVFLLAPSQHVSAERMEVISHSDHMEAMPKMPAMPPMPDMPQMVLPDDGDLQNSGSEVKLESGGQVIIIHKSHS